MTPEAMLEAGSQILAPVLVPAGFKVTSSHVGHGSGGDFGVGRWVRREQFIELHARRAVGIVRYGWDDDVFDHACIVDVLDATASYPGFSDDPLDGFRHLAADLAGPLAPVVGPASHEVCVAARTWRKPGRRLP